MLYGNANDKDLLKRQQLLQASQPVTLTQTQQNVKHIGEQPTVTPSRSDYGGSYWDQMYFTDDELKNSYNTRNAAQNGDITWDDAHSYVENIRKKYGYSGGKHGDEYILLSQPVRTDSVENTVSDVMQKMANYDQLLGSDPYQPGLDAAYQAILNRKPFEYDLEADPAWQAYRKQYTREGRRASEDTLGQYAAMTGGMPSTAAMTAAQQAGDYYNAQMTDKIPELYRLAYSMYADDASRQLADLNAIRGLSGDWYGRQMDAYGRLGDLYSMASGERSYADAQAQQAAEDAYKYAMATGDYSYLNQLGYDTSYLEKQRDKDMAELDKPELSLAEVNAAIKAGNLAPNVLKAWEYYYGAPYSGATVGYGGGYDGEPVAVTTPLSFGQGQWDDLFQSVHKNDPNETRAAARNALVQFAPYLNDYQKRTLAHLAGMDADTLAAAGGVDAVGVDTIANITGALYPEQETSGERLLTEKEYNDKVTEGDPTYTAYGTYDEYVKAFTKYWNKMYS